MQAIAAYNAQAGNSQITSSSNVSYAGVNVQVVQEIINAAASANTGKAVNVTSADDSGHAATSNHYTGNAVDVSMRNDQFNTYITQHYTPVTNLIAPGLPAYKDPTTGYIWTQESASTAGSSGNHWHVSLSGR